MPRLLLNDDTTVLAFELKKYEEYDPKRDNVDQCTMLFQVSNKYMDYQCPNKFISNIELENFVKELGSFLNGESSNTYSFRFECPEVMFYFIREEEFEEDNQVRTLNFMKIEFNFKSNDKYCGEAWSIILFDNEILDFYNQLIDEMLLCKRSKRTIISINRLVDFKALEEKKKIPVLYEDKDPLNGKLYLCASGRYNNYGKKYTFLVDDISNADKWHIEGTDTEIYLSNFLYLYENEFPVEIDKMKRLIPQESIDSVDYVEEAERVVDRYDEKDPINIVYKRNKKGEVVFFNFIYNPKDFVSCLDNLEENYWEIYELKWLLGILYLDGMYIRDQFVNSEKLKEWHFRCVYNGFYFWMIFDKFRCISFEQSSTIFTGAKQISEHIKELMLKHRLDKRVIYKTKNVFTIEGLPKELNPFDNDVKIDYTYDKNCISEFKLSYEIDDFLPNDFDEFTEDKFINNQRWIIAMLAEEKMTQNIEIENDKIICLCEYNDVWVTVTFTDNGEILCTIIRSDNLDAQIAFAEHFKELLFKYRYDKSVFFDDIL